MTKLAAAITSQLKILGDMKHNRPPLYFIGCTDEVKTQEAAYTD